MKVEEKPHGSYAVYKIVKAKMIKDVASYLRGDRTRGEWIIILIILTVAAIGGAMGAYQVDYNIVHKPLQVVGVCAPPAQVIKGGCYTVTTTVTDINGQNRAINLTTPSGQYFLLNGTGYHG